MTDNNLPHKKTELPWYSYQAKFLELSYMRGLDEKALDEEHSASEIIHTIISNLFLLNSGGIAAIPAISGFFGEKYFFGHDLVELFWRPGISFVLGEVLVLLCAFIAYLNHLYFAGFVRASYESELARINNTLPSYESNQSLVDIVLGRSGGYMNYYNRLLKLSFWTAVICGFFSMFAFIAGCYFLTGTVSGIREL
ncbi:hypothetical protein [Methylocystis sp. B8]|uniref:hypothetical protein n=1 Tax=Methylocystis sp. B8 TaxID=544938 RepID=UPI0010FDEC1D|nr:hypothetical protein [Methylocystis sp. B8]TLG72200.1 hypothetical protein FEV16_14865 [Methylocystis sp. B8]